MIPAFRPREFFLLLFPAAIVALAAASLVIARELQGAQVVMDPVFAFLGLLLAGHILLSLLGFRGDQALYPVVMGLVGFSVLLTLRLVGTDIAWRQVTWAALALVAMFLVMAVLRRDNVLRRYTYTWAALGFLLVILTFLFGRPSAPGGPRLWFDLGLFQFQPSEIWKVILVVFFASYLDQYGDVLARGTTRLGPLRLPPLPYLLPLLLMFGLSLVLLFFQRDLGAALLMFGVFLSMLFLASGRTLYLAGGLLLFGGAVVLAARSLDIVEQRVAVWLDPFAQASGVGYQIVQGLVAFAEGGVFGQGLGYGRPGVVPAIHTDYMLAAAGEEMGLLGALGIVLLYVLLTLGAFRIALQARSRFDHLLAAGLATVIGIQAIVIMAGSLKLIPLTGVTLPFLSYGGSSLLTNFVILGILLHVSRQGRGVL